jgi:paraquat-inducible protein B
VQLIEEKIRELEKTRDALKIKNIENELISVKHELKQSRKVIEGSKRTLLDSALNQLKAYNNLEELSQSPWD